MSTLLRVDGIEVGYGDLTAVGDVSLEVREGETVALIGANGAGKTTTLRAISGLLPLRRGRIEFDGQRLDGLTSAADRGPRHRPRAGGPPALPDDDGAGEPRAGRAHAGGPRAGGPRPSRGSSTCSRASGSGGSSSAGTLSGGEQQMCAIGRGLMACPRLLMLDEPSLGLAPVMVKAIFEDLGRINAQGLTILLVEQNVLRSLHLAHRGYVLENGRVTRSGQGPELLASGHIKQAYLGL